MTRLNKDAWTKSSLRTEEVEVEELGGSVLIRELPASVSTDLEGLIEMIQIGREQRAKVDTTTMERRQFAYGVIDDNHNPIFNEDEVTELQGKHGRAFRVVVKAIDKLSGVDKEALEKAEARFPGGQASTNGANVGDAAHAEHSEPAVPVRAGGDAGDDDHGDR